MNSRREFLKAAAIGTGSFGMNPIASKLTSAYADATTNATSIPHRFIFVRKSNGIRPNELALPSFSEKDKASDRRKEVLEVDLENHELPSWLSVLNPHKGNLGILQGLSCKMSENGHYSYSSVMGAFKSGRNSLSGIKRATIDFELARLNPSPFGHVELSLTGNYSNFRAGIVPGYSAPAAHQRNYCYADPETAYNELFKSILDPKSVDSENQMLKFLEQEESFKASQLAGYERLKLSNHVASLDSIKQRNLDVASFADLIREHLPNLDPVHADGGVNASTPEKQKAMTEILIAALATGLTNVVTYTIDELSTPIRGLPGNESDRISIHELGHNGGYSGVSAEDIREKIRIGHLEQIEHIANRLKNIPEGEGSMFDHTMIFYFPENGETHHSHGTEAPFVVLAGDACPVNIAGRYLRLPYHGTEGHQTLGNWYTTLLNAHGNPIDHYGDLDLEMSRKKLAQTGSIPQLLS